MPTIYVNGRFIEHMDAALDPLDRGVLLGDGLFETVRCEGFHPLFHDLHHARLSRSARMVEIPLSLSSEDFLEVAEQVLDSNGMRNARLRVTVTRGELHGSPDIAESPTAPTVIFHVQQLDTAAIEGKRETGWRARVLHFPMNHLSPLAQVKSTSYQERVLARHWSRRDGLDEGIFLNTDGLLAEGAMSNLFLVTGGRVRTPPPSDGALPGIMRENVIRLCTKLSIPFVEESLTLEDLRSAEEAFMTNSLIEVMPLVKVGRDTIGEGEPGAIAKKLQEEHRGEVERFLATIKSG